MAESPFSSSHFEVRIEGGEGEPSHEVGLCFVGPLVSEDRGEDPAPRPSRAGYAPVVLRRALGEDRFLFDWRRNVAAGRDDRRTVSLRIFSGRDRRRAIELRLEACRPRRWSGPRLDALDGGIAFEEVELEYDKLIWV